MLFLYHKITNIVYNLLSWNMFSDSFFKGFSIEHYYSSASDAFYLYIHTCPYNFKFLASTGMLFFQLDSVSYLKLHRHTKHLLVYLMSDLCSVLMLWYTEYTSVFYFIFGQYCFYFIHIVFFKSYRYTTASCNFPRRWKCCRL